MREEPVQLRRMTESGVPVSETILITGSVGTVGKAVVGALRARGQVVRATLHYPDMERESRIAAIDYIEVDLGRPDTLVPAFAGIAKAAIITPEGPSTVTHARNIAAAAATAGVRQLVKVSFLNADRGLGGRLAEWHRQSEEILATSGVPLTVLRPNLFMQNFITLYGASIAKNGVVRLPTGESRVSYIDVRDIAECASAVLLDSGHEGRAYDLTGAESLTHAEIAATIARTTGHEVAFVDESGDEAAERLERLAAAGDDDAAMRELWAAVRDRGFARVTDDVERLTGELPRSFASFVRDHRHALTGA